MLVAARGQEQEAVLVLLADPIPNRERLALIRQELQRPEVGRQHGAHRERGLRVLRIDDRLRDRAFHGLGQCRQVGLEQMVDQDLVLGDALLPEHAGAVGEQLPRRRHPERVHRVLLLRDQRGRHHVEVARVAGFEKGRPARRPRIERVHQHVARGIEEGPGVAPHLVVDHAALAPGADLRDEIGDQHGLARSGGARDDGVLGLGALRIRDAGNAVGAEARRTRHPVQDAEMGGPHPAAQFSRRHQLGAPDALAARELHAPVPEPGQEEGDDAGADLGAEPGAPEHLRLDALARPPGRHRGHDVADLHHALGAVGEADLLARIGRVADRELELGEREHAGGVPLRARGAVPEVPGRHRHRHEGGEQHRGLEQLAPHADRVEDGLAAPERAAAEAAHQGRLEIAGHAAARWRPAGAGAKQTGPEEGTGDSLSPLRRHDRRPRT